MQYRDNPSAVEPGDFWNATLSALQKAGRPDEALALFDPVRRAYLPACLPTFRVNPNLPTFSPAYLPTVPSHLPSFLPTYPPTHYLPTYLPSTYLPACLPACLSTCLPTHPPTHLPTYLPSCLPTYLPACRSPSNPEQGQRGVSDELRVNSETLSLT